jgi:hypothetical protein
MSSIIRHAIKITQASEQVMREALPLLSHLGIEYQIAQSNLTDYWGRDIATSGTTIVLNIHGNRYPVGINIENGVVRIVGDFHGARVGARELEKAIAQVYTAKVSQMAMARMGYRTTVSADKKVLRVRGVSA